MPNRLKDAASPYLRSHSDNPVDWWPWGPEPFAEAVARDVPVLVSIGYSTCHWCHVMARESFSDPVLAALINENFVAIKVDREEHAEVDSTYMAAATAFTGNLGWPLNVFVTPQGRAFFAGTYWPSETVSGAQSFRVVLGAVLDAWRERRVEVERGGAAIAAALAAAGQGGDSNQSDGSSEVSTAFQAVDFAAVVAELASYEDTRFGGFTPTRAADTSPRDTQEPPSVGRGAPKFPVAPVVDFLLTRSALGDSAAASLAKRTLTAVEGLRDRVDGGFFRYATHSNWSEPHYERMLYDNAQLLAAYARAAKLGASADVTDTDAADSDVANSGAPGHFVEVTSGIAGWLASMQQPGGGFASAQDSESTVDGNRVEGFYYSLDAASRSRVDPPPVDTKVLTGWNGLAIEALALSGRLLDRPDWVDLARTAADFLLEHHVGGEGKTILVRASIDGVMSEARATLEDVGMLATGLLELAVATGEVRYAVAARRLVDASLAVSARDSSTETFAAPDGPDPVLHSQGLAVNADPSDGALPSGIAATANAAHRLFLLTGHEPYRRAAGKALAGHAQAAQSQPISFGSTLAVMAVLAQPTRQLVVVGDDPVDAAATLARNWQRPGTIALALDNTQAVQWASAGFELLEGRTSPPGVTTAWVCTDFVCQLPTTTPVELERELYRVGARP